MSTGSDHVDKYTVVSQEIRQSRNPRSSKTLSVLVDPESTFLTQKYFQKVVEVSGYKSEIYSFQSVGAIIQHLSSGNNWIIVVSKHLLKMKCSFHNLKNLERLLLYSGNKGLVVCFDTSIMRSFQCIPCFKQKASLTVDFNVLESSVDILRKYWGSQYNDLTYIQDLAESMAWSYFYSHLQFILQGLPELITESKLFRENVGHISFIFYIMIPGNSEADKVHHIHENRGIKHVQYFTIEKMIAGSRKRFIIPVYQLENRNPQGTCYFCGEIPAILDLLTCATDEFSTFVSVEEKSVRSKMFFYKLEEILNHYLNRECRDLTKLIYYTGTSPNLSDLLMTEIEKEITTYDDLQLFSEGNMPFDLLSENRENVNDVCLVFGKENKKRASFASRMLDTNRYDHSTVTLPTNSEVDICREKMIRANWIFLFISSACTQDENLLTLELLEIFGIVVTKCTIVVLTYDINIQEIPTSIGWTRVIDMKDDGYLLQIMHTLSGKVITKTSPLPVGQVAECLAIEYVETYLKHVLSNFKVRLQEKATELYWKSHGCQIASKFILIIPKDGKCRDNLIDISVSDMKIEHAGRVDTIRNPAGTFGRIYLLSLFKIMSKIDEEDLFFAGEYALPVKTLFALYQSDFAVYDFDRLITDIRLFYEQLNMMLQHNKDLCGTCQILYSEDESTLIEQIVGAVHESVLPVEAQIRPNKKHFIDF